LVFNCFAEGEDMSELVQVMLDRDLAELYEVKPIRLREKVKRNIDRFPVGSKRKRHSPMEAVPFSILP
jgi:hypothetical protein